MAITWATGLETGIEVIDNQHRRIVDYINQLEGAISRQSRSTVGQVLDELVDYTLSHFAFEESLQEEAGYKFATPHKAVHQLFVKRLAKYQERHNAGENVGEQLHGMLATWLVHHIKRDDMAYVPAVQARVGAATQNGSAGREEGWLGRSLKKFFK